MHRALHLNFNGGIMKTKTKSILLIILIATLVGLVFNLFTYESKMDYDEYVVLPVVFIGLLAGLVFLVFLFVKKWRKNYLYIPLFVGLASVLLFTALILPLDIKRDAFKQAKKEAERIANDNNLQIRDVILDSVKITYFSPKDSTKFFTVTAKRKEPIENGYNQAFKMANDSVALFIEVSGSSNERVILNDTKNLFSKLTNDQLRILERGGYFEQECATDKSANRADYDGFLDFMRNQLVRGYCHVGGKPLFEAYKEGKRAIIKVGIQADHGKSFKDPYLLFIFDNGLCFKTVRFDGMVNTKRQVVKEFKLNNVGDWNHVRFYFVPSEYFDDEWLEKELLSINYFYLIGQYRAYKEWCFDVLFEKGTIEGLKLRSDMSEEEKREEIQELEETLRKLELVTPLTFLER